MPIATLLMEAGTKWAIKKVASEGVDGLKKWLREEAERDGVLLNENQLQTLDGLLGASDTFFKVVLANIKFWNSGGALIAGPSGGGKSTLSTYLETGQLADTTSSTSIIKSTKIRYEAYKYSIKDTPGQHEIAEYKEDVTQALRLGSERVLLMVFSGGFLKTEGIVNKDGLEIQFKRPHRDAAPDLATYLSICAEEEIEWLQAMSESVRTVPAQRAFRYILVVINKADHWWEDREHVRKYYKGNLSTGNNSVRSAVEHLTEDRSKRFKTALDTLVGNCSVQGLSVSYHEIASAYDSMYQHAPSGVLSQQIALLSLVLFRAQLRVRFSEL